MKKISSFLIGCLAGTVPLSVFAAGTYYNGNYQSPQQRYSTSSYSQGGSYNNQNTNYSNYNRMGTNNNAQQGYSNNPYSSYNSRYSQNQGQAQQQPSKKTATASDKQGFYLNGGISRETAMWQFEMKESASILHYDNISWNVFDINAGYGFTAGNTPMQIDLGLKTGMQSGESTMVDDDITNGGYFITEWVDSSDNTIGSQIGHALSIGTSSGGSMFGMNIGFGLTDFFKVGNARITPSIGYRQLSYTLETKNNYGLSVDTAACFTLDSGETQCDPAVIVHYSDDSQQILWRDLITGDMLVGANAESIDAGGTYYYAQPSTSHSYEVSWSGPYVAMDLDYKINQYNSVNGRLELGFPGYTATGDQPYRFDWQHPKSVEDTAGMGSAMHLGMAANWQTAMTDTIMLSIGLTYDYYSVSGANAKTYLSGDYYNEIYDTLLTQWQTAGFTETDMLNTTTGDPTALNIKALEEQCPGWVCSTDSEIDSFYKSMGIRVGLNAKF